MQTQECVFIPSFSILKSKEVSFGMGSQLILDVWEKLETQGKGLYRKLSRTAVSFFQLFIAVAGLRDCSVGEHRLEETSVIQFHLL